MFTVDHEQAKGFEQVKSGEYEVTVVNYELKQADSGNNMIVVDYEIRSDVDRSVPRTKALV